MRMVQVLWYRKGHLLIPAGSAGGKPAPDFTLARDMGSINKAKRESREIQLANGGLGAGAVQVLR